MKLNLKLHKLITFAALGIMSVAAHANDNLKIYHTGGKTGTSMIFANEYAKDFKPKHKAVEAIGLGGCAPTLRALKTDKEPSVVLWDTGMLPIEECNSEFTKQPPVTLFVSYYMLCTSAENNYTLADFAKGGRVALNVPLDFWSNWYRDFGAVNNTRYTNVPVGDSGKQILSLVSKETDWAMIAGQRARAQMQDKKLRCVASTNPAGEEGLPFVGTVAKGFDRSELLLAWASYVTNASAVDRAKIESNLGALHKSPEFQKFMREGHIVDYTHAPAAAKKKFYEHMIHVMGSK